VVWAQPAALKQEQQRADREDQGRNKSRSNSSIRTIAIWANRESVELYKLKWVAQFNNHRLLAPTGHIPPAEADANHNQQFVRQVTTAVTRLNKKQATRFRLVTPARKAKR
jgi:hypothetical protein